MKTIFNIHQFESPIKEMAYNGQANSKLRRMVGNSLFRLERGVPLYRKGSTTPVVALPQFNTQVVQSPTSTNKGSLLYDATRQQIERPTKIGNNGALR